MAEKKEIKKNPVVKKEFKGDLLFHHLDPHMAGFHLTEVPEMLTRRVVEFKSNVLPKDFELSNYRISGKFSYEITYQEITQEEKDAEREAKEKANK